MITDDELNTQCVVYKCVNKINGKIYVGKTIGTLQRRLQHHKRSTIGLFPAALRKYGEKNFEFSILAICTDKNHLIMTERYWISQLDCIIPNGYNLTEGGEGMHGHIPSEETRLKMSISSLGTNMGEKNGMYGKPSPRLGAKNTDKMNKENSIAHKTLWNTPEYREKVTNAHKGKPQSEETRIKRSISMRLTLAKKRSNLCEV